VSSVAVLTSLSHSAGTPYPRSSLSDIPLKRGFLSSTISVPRQVQIVGPAVVKKSHSTTFYSSDRASLDSTSLMFTESPDSVPSSFSRGCCRSNSFWAFRASSRI
jgi:hypothetical protein